MTNRDLVIVGFVLVNLGVLFSGGIVITLFTAGASCLVYAFIWALINSGEL